MPIPFILGAAAAAAAAIGGLAAHSVAKENNKEAERILEEAKDIYYSGKRSLEEAQKATEEALLKLGYSKKEVLETSVKQFLENYKKIKDVEIKKSLGLNEIENFSIKNQEALELKEMSNIYESAFSKGAAGAATGAVIALAASGSLPVVTGVLSTAGSLAVAGNIGAAAGLAGSALSLATSLTPLAAIAAPVMLFTGISSVMKADENLEKARTVRYQADAAVAEMRVAETLCKGIARNAEMFNDLLYKLNTMFLYCNNLLDGLIKRKTWIFRKKVKSKSLTEDELKLVAVTRALAGAVKAVIDTPILNKDGKISEKAELLYKETNQKMESFVSAVEEIERSNIKASNLSNKFNIKNTLFLAVILTLIISIVFFIGSFFNQESTNKLEKVVTQESDKQVAEKKGIEINNLEKDSLSEKFENVETNFNSLDKTEKVSDIEEIVNNTQDLEETDDFNLNNEIKAENKVLYNDIPIANTDKIINSSQEQEAKVSDIEEIVNNTQDLEETDNFNLNNEIKAENKVLYNDIPIANTDKIINSSQEQETKVLEKSDSKIDPLNKTVNKIEKTKKKVKKTSNKYNGPERNQFILLNGKSVFIDSNGNIVR